MTKQLGETNKTNREISAFNQTYLANNPEYRVQDNNCQGTFSLLHALVPSSLHPPITKKVICTLRSLLPPAVGVTGEVVT